MQSPLTTWLTMKRSYQCSCEKLAFETNLVGNCDDSQRRLQFRKPGWGFKYRWCKNSWPRSGWMITRLGNVVDALAGHVYTELAWQHRSAPLRLARGYRSARASAATTGVDLLFTALTKTVGPKSAQVLRSTFVAFVENLVCLRYYRLSASWNLE